MRVKMVRSLLLLSFIAAFAVMAAGQSGLIFIPSTHTQDKGTFHLSLETYMHFDKYSKGGFQSYGPSLVYGVSKNVEVGMNYYLTRDIDGTTHEIEPHFKIKAYDNEDNGVAIAVGTLAFIPLNKRSTNRSSAVLYANTSKQFKTAGDLKITGGIYTVFTGDDAYGDKAGAIVGIEKPLGERFTALADWVSGNNRLGSSSIALSYNTRKTQVLTVAYSFGNTGRGNNILSAYYGITF
jgi:hypothetical protein